MKKLVTTLFVLIGAVSVLGGTSSNAQVLKVVRATRVHTSIPLRDMRPAPRPLPRAPYAIQNRFLKFSGGAIGRDQAGFVDVALQSTNGGLLTATVGVNFEGTSDDDNFAVWGGRIVPPDTEGDVGPNHYVQWNNLVAEIFSKNGSSLLGPFPGNQFFQQDPLGNSPCQTDNHGDPIVRYDELADRWVFSQFAEGVGPTYFMCIAVSTGSDPTGSYHQYEFQLGTDLPDYPKLGVWPDAYYMTVRNFENGSSFTGVRAFAVDRANMLQGSPATMQIFEVPGGTANDGWLPADLDGPAPPVNSPGIFVGAPNTTGSNEIQLVEIDVDWADAKESSINLIATLPTDPFDTSVSFVPQKRPGENLDALAFTLMFPMQYRNFGTYQTLMLNHTVDVGRNRAGIRWYELRNSGGAWSIHQQGTYAPGNLHRWMGSIAMNGLGDIALAYTASARNKFPSIRFTGQTAVQSGSGVMNVAEQIIIEGGGSQVNSFNRWGDYSATSVDPVDDETFWHTNEYYAATGSFDFKTRIAAFTIGGDGGGIAETVHVEAIETSAQGVGKGQKKGKATITIFDDLGNPAGAGYLVTGTFSGDFEEPGSGTTGSDGVATILTSTTERGKLTFDFCVSSVNKDGGLTYVPGIFACPNAPAKAGISPALATVDADLPGAFSLDQNYPNPFNPTTNIQFDLPETTPVTLIVYDVMGREVRRLVDESLPGGTHIVPFNASALPSGAYVYRLSTSAGSFTRMMLLLK